MLADLLVVVVVVCTTSHPPPAVPHLPCSSSAASKWTSGVSVHLSIARLGLAYVNIRPGILHEETTLGFPHRQLEPAETVPPARQFHNFCTVDLLTPQGRAEHQQQHQQHQHYRKLCRRLKVPEQVIVSNHRRRARISFIRRTHIEASHSTPESERAPPFNVLGFGWDNCVDE